MDDGISDDDLRRISDGALKCADAMRRLHSAFVVFDMEFREAIEAIYPELRVPRSADEIAESAIARARKTGQA